MDTRISMSEETYSNYLSEHLKLNILRDLLSKSKPFAWEDIIRGVLDIPKEEQE